MAITGFQPLYNNAYVPLVNRNPLEKTVSRAFRRMNSRRGLMVALNGAATGGTATVQEKRVQHDRDMLGGVRPIETFTYVNRATNAADETAGDELLVLNSRIATPSNGAGTWPAL